MRKARFWALALFYEPFTMGGDVWHGRRYEVTGESCGSVEGHETFAYASPEGEWRVHEKITGGLLGEGDTLRLALEVARKNVRETPDFDEQKAKLGPVERHGIIGYDEAMRRIAKHDRKEKAKKARNE